MLVMEELNKLFREKGRTLGCVESFTGGLFASEVVAVPGASHFFKGGLVTYTNEEKNRILSIPYAEIDKNGVVSQEIAGQMAGNGSRLLNVNYCVAFTGNAGPEVMEDKPAGEVYVAVTAYDLTRVYKCNLSGNRDEIRKQAVEIGARLVMQLLNENN